jgi:hypothetical protein
MCFFLVLFWCSVVARDILGDNSRFGVLNSRLGRSEFPVSLPRESVRKGLIWLAVFAEKRGARGQNRQNSRFHGKNREFVSAR